MATNVVTALTLTCKNTKLIRNNIFLERIRNLPKLPQSISEVVTLYINNAKLKTV